MKTVFSGIQPSGNLHIGNYIGAISQWIKMQDEFDCLYCIVDLHAITVPQDPKVLKEKTKDVAALYLASGLNPEKAHIFIQSENADHPYLAWIFNTITPMGWLNRMTQYKDKASKLKSAVAEVLEGQSESVGLFDYPALMAADILLYDTDEVPVGEDQKQHIELTRDIAEKFNKTFGETFRLPAPRISADSARIMSLQNPDRKMSKSDIDPAGTINILDSDEEIREKVKKAVTDSGSTVSGGASAAMNNLLAIYASMKDTDLASAISENDGKSYSAFKKDLTDVLIARMSPIREKYHEIRKDEKYLNEVLSKGLEYAMSKSTPKIREVREKVGLV